MAAETRPILERLDIMTRRARARNMPSATASPAGGRESDLLADLPSPAPGTVAAMRARDHDQPDDTAFYSCACGLGFVTEVSSSPTCPSCGGGQPW